MEDILALKRLRGVIKGSMTKLVSYAKTCADAHVDEIKIRMKRAQDLMDQFIVTDSKILRDPAEESHMDEFEESYYQAIADLNARMRQRSTSSVGLPMLHETNLNATQLDSEVRLPKLNIPPFAGEYTEWQSFFDLYTSAIHDKETLSPAQKFQYLKGLLKGEAAALIRHFSITEANYIEAFQKLCQRYSRKRHTVNAFIKTFMDQPTITQANAQNVRKLMDTSDEVIRGLKALGNKASERDPWILHTLVAKLDNETKAQWAQETTEQDFPTFEEFIKFLGKRVDALESIRACSKVGQVKKYQAHAITTVPTKEQCPVCNKKQHRIYECETFKEMPNAERVKLIKEANRCFNCLSNTHRVYDCRVYSRCKECRRKHHTLLHDNTVDADNAEQVGNSTPNILNVKTTSIVTQPQACLKVTANATSAILPTAVIKIRDVYGEFHKFRALLDSASQASFISENCAQTLKLPRENGRILVQGMGQAGLGHARGCVELMIESSVGVTTEITTKAFIMSRIGYQHASCKLLPKDYELVRKVELADPKFNEAGAIEVLLGVDIFLKVIQAGKITLSNSLVALNTSLGWVLAGHPVQRNAALQNFNILLDIDRSLRRFWEVEEMPKTIQISEDEEKCEHLFCNTTKRDQENRFVVRLPFRQSPKHLGSSYNLAITRLRAMERRFHKNQEFAELYRGFMKEYQSLGHMQLVEEHPDATKYFLPHHGVIKAASTTTKLRVVFDASAKSNSGVSLNDILMVGPVVQSPLINIMIRFRQHKFVVTGDIEKMYRQIRIHDNDCEHQRILWRSHESEPVRTYQLKTVTYGTAPAAFLATRAIMEVGNEIQSQYPEAANAIKNDIYVDDLLTGSSDKIALQTTMGHIINSLQQSGFSLRKLQSNNSELQNKFKEIDRDTDKIKIISKDDGTTNILGLTWNSANDEFIIDTDILYEKPTTKRALLSTASKIFDPLGWLSPVTIRIKILFQSLWAENIDWDDTLPKHIQQSWFELQDEIRKTNTIKIPRWIHTERNVILHGFSDASEKAYAAVVYAVAEEGNCRHSTLIAAKTRVAPIKQLSIPRLELMGALLLTQLMNLIKESLTLPIQDTVLWSDSQIVLAWLSDHPRKWTTFVGNRTSEILTNYHRSQWKHVPSKENPADSASRGLLLENLSSHNLWWNGPQWIVQGEESWPKQDAAKANTSVAEERRQRELNSFITSSNTFIEGFCEKYSNAYTAFKVFAMMLRYINNIKAKLRKKATLRGNISREEIITAENILLRCVQQQYFGNEFTALAKKQPIPNRSKIKALNPFLDDNGLIRVGGRIQKSIAQFSVKHPIILPNTVLTKLIVLDLHQFHHHAGVSLLTSVVRRRFWIIRCKDLVKSIIHKCTSCFRQSPMRGKQIMGNLPEARVTFTHPFHQVGIDYCGPFKIHTTRRRGQQPVKGYVCIFVCLSTKATHIEIAGSLSTESFLGALKRFIARRGICHTIYSDNGTNFVGAKNDLKELFQFIDRNNNEFSSLLLRNKITWKFNPPAAPHMGGIWEAAVKSAKVHLKRVIGEAILTLEEFTTLMTQIEAIMNSRPLCSNTSEEIDALTPAHFLIGRTLTDIPEIDITADKILPNERWKLIKQIKQHFWVRWHKEYLRSLQTRPKWHTEQINLKEGDIVLLVEDNLPSTCWALAKIIKTHPGDDGIVRVVTIKVGSSGKLIQRPISKLCKLPEYPIESGDSRPAGNVNAAYQSHTEI